MSGDQSPGDEAPPRLDARPGAADAMFRAIYDQSSHLMGVLDLDGRVRHANRAACEFIDESLDQIVGVQFWETPWWAHSAKERQKLRDAIQRARRGESVQFDTTHRAADGSTHDMDFVLKPARDDEGRVFCLLPEARDITERKKTEAALRDKTDELDRYFTNALDLLCIADTHGFFRRVNKQWESTLGYSPPELEGRRFLDFVHPDDRDATLSALAQLGAQRTVSDFVNRYRHRDGSYRSFEWRCFPAGQIIYAVARDITGKLQSEEALRESMRRLQTIVNGAPIILYSFDANGVFTLSDGKGLEGMGLRPSEVVGHSVFDVYRDRPDILDNMRRSLAGETFTVPVTVGDRVFDAYHTPLLGDRREYVGTIGVLVDITERKRVEAEAARLQEQLQQAMKMEAVGRLAGGIAHDFNNLLTTIMGNVELARMETDAAAPLTRYLSEVSKASESAASLIRQLLAFSRRQMIEPKVLSLNELVHNLETMLTRLIGEDVDLQTNLASDLGVVKVDPGQFEQVLVNLAVNARDAMPEGGKLVIETANIELDAATCARHGYVSPGSFVVLGVSDTGEGMTEEVKKRLFEPFFTTKPVGRGTGLGLATIFGAVKQAGGTIEVHSEVNRGTTFRIYLPRTEGRAAELLAQAPTEDLPRGTETVLLVENEASVRDLARGILERLGYQVLDASNGRDALYLVDGFTEHIDLLLTDVVMPGMSGRDLADRLLRLRPGTKVLFASGYTEDVIVHHGVLEQNLNFIGKPYSVHGLARKVRDVLGA